MAAESRTALLTNLQRPLAPIDLIGVEEEPIEAIIACEIETWPQGTWEPRTYHAVRNQDGSYKIYVGDGLAHECLPSWYRVAKWLQSLRVRNLEVLVS